MADWSLPTLSSTYANFLSQMAGRINDAALQFSSGTITNVPTGAIKWDSSVNRWRQWNGTSWAELTTTYGLLNVTVNGDLNVTGNTTLGDSSADSVTVNASTFNFANATTIGGNLTFSGGISFNGNVTLGDAPADSVTINAATVTFANASTINGSLTFGGSISTNGQTSIGTTVAQGNPSSTSIGSTAHTILSGAGGNVLAFGQYPGSNSYAQWIQSCFTNPSTAVYGLVLQPIGGSVVVGSAFATRGKLEANGIISSYVPGVAQSGFWTYNGGGVSEWFVGQRSGTDHAYKICSFAGSTYTEQLTINLDGTIVSQNVAAAPGYKGIVSNPKTAAYTLTAEDMGKSIDITTGGVTIPDGLPDGFACQAWNNSGSAQTITKSGTEVMRKVAGTTATSYSLASYGKIFIEKRGSIVLVSGDIT